MVPHTVPCLHRCAARSAGSCTTASRPRDQFVHRWRIRGPGHPSSPSCTGGRRRPQGRCHRSPRYCSRLRQWAATCHQKSVKTRLRVHCVAARASEASHRTCQSLKDTSTEQVEFDRCDTNAAARLSPNGVTSLLGLWIGNPDSNARWTAGIYRTNSGVRTPTPPCLGPHEWWCGRVQEYPTLSQSGIYPLVRFIVCVTP